MGSLGREDLLFHFMWYWKCEVSPTYCYWRSAAVYCCKRSHNFGGSDRRADKVIKQNVESKPCIWRNWESEQTSDGGGGKRINQLHDCTLRTNHRINQAYIQFYLLYCSLASELSLHTQQQGKAAIFNFNLITVHTQKIWPALCRIKLNYKLLGVYQSISVIYQRNCTSRSRLITSFLLFSQNNTMHGRIYAVSANANATVCLQPALLHISHQQE